MPSQQPYRTHRTPLLCSEDVHELQPEGEGPAVMMEPLRQHDPGGSL
jgi:hypothetical protein